jgi:hypothetical protein
MLGLGLELAHLFLTQMILSLPSLDYRICRSICINAVNNCACHHVRCHFFSERINRFDATVLGNCNHGGHFEYRDERLYLERTAFNEGSYRHSMPEVARSHLSGFNYQDPRPCRQQLQASRTAHPPRPSFGPWDPWFEYLLC